MLQPVEPRHAYLLMNHGPVTLITSAHEGTRNVMAASWVMPLDYQPPKVVAVIDRGTRTRQLIEGSGVFGVNLPTRGLVERTLGAGRVSALKPGEDLGGRADKIDALDFTTFRGEMLGVPLIDGCAAWLECRLIAEPHIASAYDLFVAEVVAAWADDRYFVAGRWQPGASGTPQPPTIHYVAGGQFFESGPLFEVLPAVPAPD